jgi:hypothetical protein
MRYRTRDFMMAGTSAFAFCGLLLAYTPAAQAAIPDAPPCIGASCVGKSPNITNAEGQSCVTGGYDGEGAATSLETVDAPGDGSTNQVTLRWSAFCQANWARWSGPSDDAGYADYFSETTDGHIEYPEGSGYTYMVNGVEAAKACVVSYTFSWSDGVYACTNWF